MRNSLDIEGRPADTRVVVAMSGGVDCAVTAALLKAEGYDVVGVTLQLYDHGAATHRKGACCAGQDIHDARMVAGSIGIPHYVLDYESRFKAAVIDRFADSYVAGETPVPCVDCNQAIKFRDLLVTARDLGAKVLATGRVVVGPREALRTTRVRLRDVNWIGDGSLDAVTAQGRLDVFVKVRSTRPPHPAWLMRGPAGVEVELADGEEGVAPGQACAF